jgi:hypothetical protein
MMLTRAMYDAALREDAARWEIHSDLGASLHAMRQLGHWRPFTRASRGLFARLIAEAIEAHAPAQHQQSRRVGPPHQEQSHAEQTSRHLW